MTPRTGLEHRADQCTMESVLAHSRRRLVAAGIEAADQEARWLIEHALGLTGSSQLVAYRCPLNEQEIAKIESYLARRTAREPLQYILGTQEFCGLEFEVNPAVLIPRPETELLVQEVIRRLPRNGRAIVVDVGTGSGCLAVTLARAVPDVTMFATDLSAEALETAKRNARRHGVETAIQWLQGNLLAPLAGPCRDGAVTAIVANPPYIRETEWSGLQPEVRDHEPRMALVAGASGTEFHERLLDEAVRYLSPGGFLAMELGKGQTVGVLAKVKTLSAYAGADVLKDELAIDRIVVVNRTR